ncbi:hypothetical protein D3C81_2099830 [compost metagenome]
MTSMSWLVDRFWKVLEPIPLPSAELVSLCKSAWSRYSPSICSGVIDLASFAPDFFCSRSIFWMALFTFARVIRLEV